MPSRGWVPRIANPTTIAAALLLCISAPRPGPAAEQASPGEAVPLRLPADILYQDRVGPDRAVIFRHSTHVEMAGRSCVGCHPRPFLMLSPSHRTSHAVMNAGGACGSCHDGRKAFGVRDAASCRTCHTGRSAQQETIASSGTKGAAPPSPVGGRKPIVYARSQGSPGRVTFRHETHLRGATCASCHPKAFPMKALSAPPSAMHGTAACGKCHDGKTAFGVEDADRCARCHTQEKGTP